MIRTKILGLGSYVPDRIVPNEELHSSMISTSDRRRSKPKPATPDLHAMNIVDMVKDATRDTLDEMAGARVVHWNGKDVPDELRELPAGAYLLEPVDRSPPLTAEEEDGLRAAMASLRADTGRTVDQVRQSIDTILRR